MLSKTAYNEMAIGHIFTLVQLDWPQEEDFVPPLLEQIQQHVSFQYHNFQVSNYIFYLGETFNSYVFLYSYILPQLCNTQRCKVSA